ncbi:MAG: FAD-dependent oxidoreductase, partial [Pseudomonadota bacterium]|nr:FAD-dependent oxidoreductase [Pseudomonadota bacterium]
AGAPQPDGALVVQAAPDWSASELERDPDSIAAALLSAYQVMIGETMPTPRYAAAHRWRYARVTKPADENAPRLSGDGRITIAGDWVAGARVEDAFMSGHRAMTTMLATD